MFEAEELNVEEDLSGEPRHHVHVALMIEVMDEVFEFNQRVAARTQGIVFGLSTERHRAMVKSECDKAMDLYNEVFKKE